MLELIEEALDQVAFAIDSVVDGTLDLTVTGGRDVCPSTARFDKIDDSTRVIASVSNEVPIWLEAFDQSRRNGLVGRLTLRKHDPYGHSLLIDYRADFGAQSSARATNGVIRPPFLPPAACWLARIIEESISCSDCGDLAASASNIRSQMPALAQRLNRLYTVV
jgi:hypothetical protein